MTANGPLAVQLESLDRTHYKARDEVVGEVRVTNVGAKPVMIPWSPDPETVFRKNCEWRPKSLGVTAQKAMISLEFEDEAGFTQFIASHGLYGISSNAETYRKLAPHQTAVIKIWGTVDFYNMIEERRAKGLEFKLPQKFAARARFEVDDSSFWVAYKTLRSTNQIRVRVEPAE